MHDHRLFMTTTNGTRALEIIQASPSVLAAALINRRAVVDYVLSHRPETIWIVGAGWEGSFALEDTVCAGAIAHSLIADLNCTLEDIAGNDELTGAVALYDQWKDDLLGLFHLASHGKRLLRLDCHDDLKYCAQTDVLDVLPIQREIGVLVKNR